MTVTKENVEYQPAYQMIRSAKDQLVSLADELKNKTCSNAIEASNKIKHALDDLAEAQNALEAHLINPTK